MKCELKKELRVLRFWFGVPREFFKKKKEDLLSITHAVVVITVHTVFVKSVVREARVVSVDVRGNNGNNHEQHKHQAKALCSGHFLNCFKERKRERERQIVLRVSPTQEIQNEHRYTFEYRG